MTRRAHLYREVLGLEANPFSDTAIADGSRSALFDPFLHPDLPAWMARVFIGVGKASRPINLLWSLGAGSEARGYGKSAYLMWIERSINADLGASFLTLANMKANEQHRLVGLYTSFSTVDALSLSGVLYAATKSFLTTNAAVLTRLRDEYLIRSNQYELAKASHKLASIASDASDVRLISRLAYNDPDAWQNFFRYQSVWHRQRWGRRIFGSLVAFCKCLGISQLLLLIDQVEDFTGGAPSSRHHRDFGRLAEICADDPLFRDTVRIVLALHPRAEYVAHWYWPVDRLGPFPNIDDPTRCVIIRGLNPGGMAQLIVGYLSSVRPSVATNGIAPFTHDGVERVRILSEGRPGTAISMLYELIEQAVTRKSHRIDDKLVNEVFG